MTLESVEKCLIETFNYINGVPKECLTDNMSSIINYSQHEFTSEFKSFAMQAPANIPPDRLHSDRLSPHNDAALCHNNCNPHHRPSAGQSHRPV